MILYQSVFFFHLEEAVSKPRMIPYGGTESTEADECRNRGHSDYNRN
jgi:hypothetical protein